MKRLILSALLLVSASGWAQQDISRAFEHGVVTTERPQQRDIYIYTYDDLYPPPPPPPPPPPTKPPPVEPPEVEE